MRIFNETGKANQNLQLFDKSGKANQGLQMSSKVHVTHLTTFSFFSKHNSGKPVSDKGII